MKSAGFADSLDYSSFYLNGGPIYPAIRRNANAAIRSMLSIFRHLSKP